MLLLLLHFFVCIISIKWVKENSREENNMALMSCSIQHRFQVRQHINPTISAGNLHHPNQNSKYLKLLTNINKVCYIAKYLCRYIYTHTHTHIFVCSVV